MNAKVFPLLFLFLTCMACRTDVGENNVRFDTHFKGARLDSISQTGPSSYAAHVLPGFEPVNASPWYAFAVSADRERMIQLSLHYGNYQHRYIPKISQDKKNWKVLPAAQISVDTLGHTATLQLKVSREKTYVAAQEIESAADTYAWMQGFLKNNPSVQLKQAGRSLRNKPNYVLEHEHTGLANSLFIVARQHPPEIPGGTIGFRAFYETLFENSELAQQFRKHFNIYAFPLLNPDGVDLGHWRHNAAGVDLNRDWVSFSQPETKMVRDYTKAKVTAGKEINFALDFHTSFSGPYLLTLETVNKIRTHGLTAKWIAAIESQSQFKVEARQRSQELPYCYNFFFNTYGAEAVTYENGDEENRAVIRERAKVYATELMKILMEHYVKMNEDE